jgi:UDP-glucose-4-epimerase GalE
MTSARVLVTGGAGYIGAHVGLALVDAGHAIVNLSNGHSAHVLAGELIVGDIADAELVTRLLSEHSVDAVIHLAGYIESGESVRDPGKYFDNNISRSLAFLETLARHGAPPVIFSSTAAIYGSASISPIPEAAPAAPASPYAVSKWAIEQALAAYGTAQSQRYMALRYFNAAGANPDARIGEAHDPETHLIPNAIRAALGGGELVINGDDYPTPDGTCVRDYVHVSDLARAHVLALEALLQGAESAVLNVGTGQGHSVRHVIDAVAQATGTTPKTWIGPRRPGDPVELIADASRIRRELGWAPEFPELGTMVAHATAWEQRRHAK